MALKWPWALAQIQSDGISCLCRCSERSDLYRDAHTLLSHKQGSLDIPLSVQNQQVCQSDDCWHALAAHMVNLAPTDADTSYTGTSGVHANLFRSDKSPFCCCTSGSLFDTILP